MATLNPTIRGIHIMGDTIGSGAVDGIMAAMVLWDVTGTYDGAATAPIEVLASATAIQNAMSNGKTVTLIDACVGQSAPKTTTGYYSTMNVVVSSGRLEMDITDNSDTVEIADGVLPETAGYFGTLVRFRLS